MKKEPDKFLNIWTENYLENFRSGAFSQNRAGTLMQLIKSNSCKNIPVVLIAAGPSLDKNLSHLKNYQSNVIIICVDVVLYKLIENDIRPDYVVSIDPSDSIHRFWSDVNTEDLTFICPTTTNPELIKKWKGKLIFFNQEDSGDKGQLLKKLIVPTQNFGNLFNRYFVGATLYQISTIFSPSAIILLGYDFAYSDQKPYCSGFLKRKLYDINNVGMNILEKREYDAEKVVLLDGKYIGTTKLLLAYKHTFEQLINTSNFLIINSTEGGLLDSTIRMPLIDSLQEYCTNTISKEVSLQQEQVIRKRKRKKKR